MYNATADVANAATHNGSPDISQSKNGIIFFSRFLHFRGTFLPVCCCVPAFILNPPLPQRKIDTSLLSQSSYQHENPAHAVPHVSHTHAHFPLCKQTNGSVLPPSPGPTSPHFLPGNIAPNRPRAPHSPIWILLGKLAPNTTPRKLVQKKAKMCCIFPFALAKKKPSSEHRFDFSPALLSLAATLASPLLRLLDCTSPSLGIQRWDCRLPAPDSRINWALWERKRARSSSTSLPRHTHTRTHAHHALPPRSFAISDESELNSWAPPEPALPQSPGWGL